VCWPCASVCSPLVAVAKSRKSRRHPRHLPLALRIPLTMRSLRMLRSPPTMRSLPTTRSLPTPNERKSPLGLFPTKTAIHPNCGLFSLDRFSLETMTDAFYSNPSPFTPSAYFSDAKMADRNGLVALGGFMTPETLYDAYVHGIFPWPFSSFGFGPPDHLGWFSLDPRGVFEFDAFHVPRRLARICRSGRFRLTSNQDFRGVLRGCALTPYRDGTSWITPSLYGAYVRFHELGFAHSVEAWLDDKLVGGVYGVAINGLFAAESMFRIEPNASKVALVALTEHLKARGYRLFDIQMTTPNTERFGAVGISRDEYLRRLHEALQVRVTFGTVGEG